MRLLLVLLALCLALPSVAVPACAREAASTAMPTMHHQDPAPVHHDNTAGEHRCLGCVPPSDWLRARLTTPVPVATDAPVWPTATIGDGLRQNPPLPPPRRG